MPLQHYRSGPLLIHYKLIKGTPHPTFAGQANRGRQVALGFAFRTDDAPVGYVPFYNARDFDLSGETSFIEQVASRLPIDLSSIASPHTLLLREAAGDVEFLGSGSEVLPDIQQAVKKDLLQHALAAASGVFIDGLMLSLGGPTIKTAVAQMLRSKVAQFIVSKSISAAAKKHLKDSSRVDIDRLLSEIPGG